MRDKDEDRFRGPNPLEGPLVPFAEAFPQIAEMTVEVEQYTYPDRTGVRGPKQTGRFELDQAGSLRHGYITCNNPRCYKGGFRLSTILSEMVETQTARREGIRAICGGMEGDRKATYSPCANPFVVTVKLKFARSEG